MCYAISLTKKKTTISDFSPLGDLNFDPPLLYEPTYYNNGFDHGNLFIITQDDLTTIVPARWGLVPEKEENWADGKSKKYDNLNARSENIFNVDSWKQSIFNKRCLILADGFFEPHHKGGETFPVYSFLKGHKLFAFAGIYAEIPDDFYSACIITKKANPFFADIHNGKHNYKKQLDPRMPVVLDDEFIWQWLRPDLTQEGINSLLSTAFTTSEFKAHTVTKEVYKNKLTYSPDAIKPVVYSDLFGNITF